MKASSPLVTPLIHPLIFCSAFSDCDWNVQLECQERLRHWEARERKKSREYEKLEQKEKERAEEQQKQAVWLKQFLEDYDDERDDAKYYK